MNTQEKIQNMMRKRAGERNVCHNKPCPHCGRTISSNKYLCFQGMTEGWTPTPVEVPATEATVESLKPKRVRKPKSVAVDVPVTASETPKRPRAPRKPKSTDAA